ncbi:MAG: rhodanese-like domain-containing protein [Nitrospirae bacterium]|nr:rhodanese-like domain-containing protein [Nitrospirota bacterium]MCL5238429.1 rhodanese-like domain-containing protein [Nitrospirota bacterium]
MKRSTKVAFLVVFACVLFICSSVFAEILMTTDDVQGIIGKPDWVVLDCRVKKKYDAGHIQGAISLGDSCRVILRDGTQRALPADRLEKILGGAGISNDKHVVVYSDGDIVHATVGYWILEYLGHDKTHFLNGGIVAWKQENKPMSKDETKLSPAVFKAAVQPGRIATTEEILKIATGKIKNVQLIDSRSAKEHTGYDVRALRGGYIPNTLMNLSHELTFDKKTGKILPPAVLGTERFFGKLDKNKRTVSYCQTGSRSTLTYLQLKLLGFKNIANYDDSWIVYGNHFAPPYPIADEQWMNLEPMQKDLPKMEKEMEKLKKEVEELKTALGTKKEHH